MRDIFNYIQYLKRKRYLVKTPQWALVTSPKIGDIVAELVASTGVEMSTAEFECLLAKSDIIAPLAEDDQPSSLDVGL